MSHSLYSVFYVQTLSSTYELLIPHAPPLLILHAHPLLIPHAHPLPEALPKAVLLEKKTCATLVGGRSNSNTAPNRIKMIHGAHDDHLALQVSQTVLPGAQLKGKITNSSIC